MIKGNQKTAMAEAFERAVAAGQTPTHCDVLIAGGMVYAVGPYGIGQCHADQPHEIGIIITEVGTNNKLGQPPYRKADDTSTQACPCPSGCLKTPHCTDQCALLTHKE